MQIPLLLQPPSSVRVELNGRHAFECTYDAAGTISDNSLGLEAFFSEPGHFGRKFDKTGGGWKRRKSPRY